MSTLLKRLICRYCLTIIFGFAMFIFIAGTQSVLATEKSPYLIKVNRACNTITIYKVDDTGEYTVPVKAMVCSVGKGSRTITGTFQTKGKYRWKLLMGDVWGQYATRIVGGILFHSVYYYEYANPASLATKEYNKLGTAASHGCIRISVGDAKWIYDNCTLGTTVIIYDDKINPGPLGKPNAIKLASTVRWDPTDPDLKNPYRDNSPIITGAKDIQIDYGKSIDLMEGINAISSLGTDITSSIKVDGTVDIKKAGKYKITYTVEDSEGKVESKRITATKTITITVMESLVPPKFVGITDRFVNGETKIDKVFALSGVEVYRGKNKLDSECINVVIDKVDDDYYFLTYQILVDGEIATAEHSAVFIDRKPPIIFGVKELSFKEGEIPTVEQVLKGITASDNYTEEKNIKLEAIIDKDKNGNYEVSYQATDEVGNSMLIRAIVNRL